MRVTNIGGIILDNPMYIKESVSSYKVTAEAHETIGGGALFFEQVREPSSYSLTLESGDYGWQTLPTITALIAFSEQKIGDDFVVQLDDGSSRICRFRYEVDAGACIAFEPRYEGALLYMGNIYLGISRWL